MVGNVFKFCVFFLLISSLIIIIKLVGNSSESRWDLRTSAQTTNFIVVSQNTASIAVYDIEELTFSLPTSITVLNPYNPDEVDAYAYITTPQPNSLTEKVIAFWSKDVTYTPNSTDHDEYKINEASGKWKIRYSPQRRGQYSYRVEVNVGGKILGSPTSTFTATDSNNKGFIRTDPSNPTRFMFDNGQAFLPIGTNLDWDQAYSQYNVFFDIYKQNKMNFARVWNIAPFAPNFLIEWKNTISKDNNKITYEGIGHYNQETAYKLDKLFEYTQSKDIYIMLTLMTYHVFWNWGPDPNNPYMAFVGGNGHNFWTSAESKKYFRWYIRYITARYSAYRSFAILEFFNEMDNKISPLDLGATGKTIMKNWYQGDPAVASDNGMIGVVNSSTPRKLLTSTSFAAMSKTWNDRDGTKSFTTLDKLDVTQAHHYDSSSNAKFMVTSWGEQGRWYTQLYKRPYFYGEYGNLGEDKDQMNTMSEQLKRLNHHSLWAPIFLGNTAASNLLWRVQWSFLPPSDFLINYKIFYSWMESELPFWRQMSWFWNENTVKNYEAGGYRKNNRAVVYFLNKLAYWNAADPAAITGAVYQITNFSNGGYIVEFTDPITRSLISSNQITVTNGILNLVLPNFSRDLAVKIFDPSETPPSITPTPSGSSSPTPILTPSPTQQAPTPTPAVSSITPSRLIGDIVPPNNVVDILDYNAVISDFGQQGDNLRSDITPPQGSVDIFDYNKVVSNFGRTQ